MTFREKLQAEYPAYVDPRYVAGCKDCPHYYGYEPNNPNCKDMSCRECWNREIPGTESPSNTHIDIHKIIDDAMKSKDRRVSIFMYKDNLSVNVEPINDSKPRWIVVPNDVDGKTNKHPRRALCKFRCSECNFISDYQTPHCPACGEKLAFYEKEE